MPCSGLARLPASRSPCGRPQPHPTYLLLLLKRHGARRGGAGPGLARVFGGKKLVPSGRRVPTRREVCAAALVAECRSALCPTLPPAAHPDAHHPPAQAHQSRCVGRPHQPRGLLQEAQLAAPGAPRPTHCVTLLLHACRPFCGRDHSGGAHASDEHGELAAVCGKGTSAECKGGRPLRRRTSVPATHPPAHRRPAAAWSRPPPRSPRTKQP